MKKLLFFLLVVLFSGTVQSQTFSEKLIYKHELSSEADGYSIRYDKNTGTYLYMYYDSTKQYKNSIISNKGNSDDYDYIDNYNAYIDAQGNYYAVSYRAITDTTYRYWFLKNGKELATYDYIGMELLEKNGVLYFICTDKNKSFISTYNIETGKLTKGKSYKEVIPCKYDANYFQEEPYATLGFTNSGEIYYVASTEKESFLVIGDKEQKHYAVLEAYSMVKDDNDNFAYIAKDTGSIMVNGGYFVVYGSKEYNRHFTIFDLHLDKENNPIYITMESMSDTSPTRVVKGNQIISKPYNGGIYNVGFTPDGKLYYIASVKKNNSDEYESFIVLDGKEMKKFQSVFRIKATPDNELLYSVSKGDNKYAVIYKDKEYDIKQSNLLAEELLCDGTLAYVGINYGDYDKKIKDANYIYIGTKEIGPYDGLQMGNYEKGEYLYSDCDGNIGYVVNNNNFEDYTSIIYLNDWKSPEFSFVQDVYLYKGKMLYTGANIVDKEKYTYKYKIFYGDKALTPEYDSINDFKFDEKTGTASFIVSKRNEIFLVEINL